MRAIGIVLAAAVVGSVSSAGAWEPPPGPFLVFFDWGKPELRSDDSATLDKIAEIYRASPRTRFQLTGHTDRSGSTSVNRAAGLERAKAIEAELVRRGVPRNAISVASLGEQQPLVPTEDGVREVQNRRVVISVAECIACVR
jgi:OmpA-OmpF porin, OOP family